MNTTCYTTTAALVGFEQEEYSVRERESGVEVCLNVQGPPGVILSEPVFVMFELLIRTHTLPCFVEIKFQVSMNMV